ncbi:MAG TPA: LysR substrate-binding domain-containing protein [Candidatus Saccharimonadales bacterium]|nr:LysR substrate-binding domain-containing protein [Candidatus Saccharimonadales bacterium]
MSDHSVLQFIAAVAEEGSFARAAKRLHTDPTFIARQIGKRERKLRVRFFDRSTRQLQLTTVGHAVLPEIHLSLRHEQRAWDLAQYYGQLMRGPFRVGCSPFTNDNLVRILYQLNIEEFEAQQVMSTDSPEPRLAFDNSTTPELVERVLRGKLHAALGVQPIHDRDLWIETIAKEPFCICLPRGHPLNQRATIPARELDGLPVFWMPEDMHPALYKRTTEYISSTGAHPRYKEIGSVSHAIELVAHGIGVALLPQSASHLSRPGVMFKPVADLHMQIETALFARQELMHDTLRDFTLFLAAKFQGVKPRVH